MKYAATTIVLLSALSGCTHVSPLRDGDTPVAQIHSDKPPDIDVRSLLPQQAPSRYWRLRSQMTTADVESKFATDVWMRGTPLGELTIQLGSVPLGTLDTMVFALADGTLTCELNRNYLQSWQIRKDPFQTASAQHDANGESGDLHRNAYFRAQSYVQHVVFLSVPLEDVPGAIRRAERATYSDLVGHYLQREEELFIHGCSCGWCRRPINSITDPARRAAAQAHQEARAQALRTLAERLDAQGIQPPSHLKPLVIEMSPHAYVKLYIPLEDIEQMEKAEQQGRVYSPPAARSSKPTP